MMTALTAAEVRAGVALPIYDTVILDGRPVA